MRGIRKSVYLTAAIWILSVPLKALAAGGDAVTLTPGGSGVSVELGMSNAQEERISAVSVSLQIDEESRNKVNAEFEFAGELNGAVQGCLYDKNTGVLNIYAASAGSLFDRETLGLGYVQLTSEEPGQSLKVELSYIGASFQTANEAYGDKAPVVMYAPEPVSLIVGNGTIPPGDGAGDGSGEPNQPDGTPGDGNGSGSSGQPGSAGSGNGNGSSTGAGTGDNRNDGLYDENTEFKNDPSSAEQISSSVVRGDGQGSELLDMSQGAAASIGGGTHLKGTGEKWASSAVSVVSPEKGPASIYVSKGKGSSTGASGAAGVKDLTGWEQVSAGEDTFGNGADGFDTESGAPEEAGDTGTGDDAGEEIRLDQKNGGAVDDSSNGLRNKVLVGAGIAVAAGGLGLGGFFAVKAGGGVGGAAKKRRRKKKHGKPAHHKPSPQGERAGKTRAEKQAAKKPASKKPGPGKNVHKRRPGR